jgi:hypothetical protein
MNGAITLLSVKTIKALNRRRTIIMGSSQKRFLTLKNSQNSIIRF